MINLNMSNIGESSKEECQERQSEDVSSRLAFHANPVNLVDTIKVKKRMSRNESEKYRRDRLNAYHQQIYELLPWSSQTHRKMDKASILRLALHYVTMHLYCSKFEKEFLKPGYFDKKFNIPEIIQSSFDFVLLISKRDYIINFATDGITTQLGHYLVDILGQPIHHILNAELDIRELQKQFSLKNTRKRKINGALPDESSSFCLHILDYTSKQHSKAKYEVVHCIGYVKDFGHCSEYLGSNEVLICVCNLGRNMKPEYCLINTENNWTSYHDLAGIILGSDTRCALPSGFLPNETRNIASYKLLHREDRSLVGALHSKFAQNGSISSVFRMYNKARQVMFIMAHTSLATGLNNEPRHIVSNNIVISEKDFWRIRQKLVEELEEESNSYKAISMSEEKSSNSQPELERAQPSPDSSASVLSSSKISTKSMMEGKNGTIKVSFGSDDRHIVVNVIEGDENSSDESEEESVLEDTRNPEFLGEIMNSDDIKVTVRRKVFGKKLSSSRASNDNSPSSNVMCFSNDSTGSPQSAVSSPVDSVNRCYNHSVYKEVAHGPSLLQKVNKRMAESPLKNDLIGQKMINFVPASSTASNTCLSSQHISKNQELLTSVAYKATDDCNGHIINLLSNDSSDQSLHHFQKTLQDLGFNQNTASDKSLVNILSQLQAVTKDQHVQYDVGFSSGNQTIVTSDLQSTMNVLPPFMTQNSATATSVGIAETLHTYDGPNIDAGIVGLPVHNHNVNNLQMNNISTVPSECPDNYSVTLDPQTIPVFFPGISSQVLQNDSIPSGNINSIPIATKGGIESSEEMTIQALSAKLTHSQILQLLSEKYKAENRTGDGQSVPWSDVCNGTELEMVSKCKETSSANNMVDNPNSLYCELGKSRNSNGFNSMLPVETVACNEMVNEGMHTYCDLNNKTQVNKIGEGSMVVENSSNTTNVNSVVSTLVPKTVSSNDNNGPSVHMGEFSQTLQQNSIGGILKQPPPYGSQNYYV